MQTVEHGAKNRSSGNPTSSLDMQLMLIVMQEGFESLNRTLSNTSSNTATAISEAFGTLKGELEIAHEEKSVEESEGTTEEPPQRSVVNNLQYSGGKNAMAIPWP